MDHAETAVSDSTCRNVFQIVQCKWYAGRDESSGATRSNIHSVQCKYVNLEIIRNFHAITLLKIIAKLIFQLGHFAPKLFAHVLRKASSWSCDLRTSLLDGLTFCEISMLCWEWVWPFPSAAHFPEVFTSRFSYSKTWLVTWMVWIRWYLLNLKYLTCSKAILYES